MSLAPAEALARVRHLVSHRPLLVVSDFDGTVARLSPDPWGASIVPLARRALRALAGFDDVEVVLLSGRGASDLAGRTRVGGATYLGDHGAEQGRLARGFRRSDLVVARDRADPAILTLAGALADAVPARVPEAWLVVERKLPSVCFHFRTAPDPDAARARVVAVCDAVDRDAVLTRIHGRRSLELRAPGSSTKGPALARLLEERRPGAVLALGDDPHDAAAFGALVAAREAGLTEARCVAVTSHPEWLAQMAPFADVVLAGADEAGRFLAGLARAVRADRAREAPSGRSRTARQRRDPAARPEWLV